MGHHITVFVIAVSNRRDSRTMAAPGALSRLGCVTVLSHLLCAYDLTLHAQGGSSRPNLFYDHKIFDLLTALHATLHTRRHDTPYTR